MTDAGQIAALRGALESITSAAKEVRSHNTDEFGAWLGERILDAEAVWERTEAAAAEHDARIRREALMEAERLIRDFDASEAFNDTSNYYQLGGSRMRQLAARKVRALADSPPPASGLGLADRGASADTTAQGRSESSGGSASQIMLLIGAGDDLEAALNPLLVLNERETSKRRKHWRTVRDAVWGTTAPSGPTPQPPGPANSDGPGPAAPSTAVAAGGETRKFRKRPAVIEAVTFDELVAHGLRSTTNIVRGMPWSFHYKGQPITHENDDCYLIPAAGGTAKLHRGDWLCSQNVNGKIDLWPVTADIFAATYEPVAAPTRADDSSPAAKERCVCPGDDPCADYPACEASPPIPPSEPRALFGNTIVGERADRCGRNVTLDDLYPWARAALAARSGEGALLERVRRIKANAAGYGGTTIGETLITDIEAALASRTREGEPDAKPR